MGLGHRASPGSAGGDVLLEAANLERTAQLGLECLDRRLELLDGGDDGTVGAGGGRADGVPVGTGTLTLGVLTTMSMVPDSMSPAIVCSPWARHPD